MKERIIRVRIRSRDPEKKLDKLREFIDATRDQTVLETPPAPQETRENVLPDEQLETKLLPEMQQFLDRLDSEAATKSPIRPTRSEQNRRIEAVESAAMKVIVALATNGFVALALKLMGL